MSNPPRIKSFVIFHGQYATPSTPVQTNYKQKSILGGKKRHIKHTTMYENYNIKNDLKNDKLN
jgi:hypothetical protein